MSAKTGQVVRPDAIEKDFSLKKLFVCGLFALSAFTVHVQAANFADKDKPFDRNITWPEVIPSFDRSYENTHVKLEATRSITCRSHLAILTAGIKLQGRAYAPARP